MDLRFVLISLYNTGMNATFTRVHELPENEQKAVLNSAEALHRQLRPKLPDDYVGYMQTMFKEGAGMFVMNDERLPVAIGVYRLHHTTFAGRRFYVDDLVTDEARRSRGFGKSLLAYLKEEAGRLAANVFTLESGTHRMEAHKFYFREGLVIPGFSFQTSLSPW
ncbi:MAG: GNAT family N-acetyltransferase [Leptospirales bacterium]|nr:GNAT family N-acetyltransferase [Leptospirales bacterium]